MPTTVLTLDDEDDDNHETPVDVASSISIGCCMREDCDCSKHVLVRLHDQENDIFAIAPLTAEAAVMVGAKLMEYGKKRVVGRA